MSALEDLIVSNRETFNDEIRAARAIPRDTRATSDFKSDEAKMKKLSDLADLPEGSRIHDCAVRGANVTFQVADKDGVLSAGFFPLESFDGSVTKAKREAGQAPAERVPQDPSPRGGTAAVATVVTEGGTPDAGETPETPPAVDGVPADIAELSGAKVAALLKDTPEGIDPLAVVQHEFAREDGPREAVKRAAASTGLLDDEGNPRTTPAA